MNRTPSYSSSRSFSNLSSSESIEDKKSEPSDNKKKKPIMRSETQDQEVERKRNAYKNSNGSTHTQATRNLLRDFKNPSSSDLQDNTRATATSTNPSYHVRSSSSRSSASGETLPSTSMVPILGTTSSTSSTTSTASIDVTNPEWAKLDEKARNASGCFFMSENIDFDEACKWLASSPAGVHSAYFLGRDISHADVIKLFDSLKGNVTLNNLDLKNNAIGAKGAQALAELLKHNTTISTLNLSSNSIGAEGAQALAELLKHNTTLTTLHLASNSLGDEGVQVIAEALKYNTALTALDLMDNYIGAQGGKAIAEALQYNTSLTSLDLDLNFIDSRLNTFYEPFRFLLPTLESEDDDLFDRITLELKKNKELFQTKKSAAAAFEIIKDRLNARGVLEDTFYPQEIMDEVLTQMLQMGLKQEVIDLGNEITPPKKSPKS